MPNFRGFADGGLTVPSVVTVPVEHRTEAPVNVYIERFDGGLDELEREARERAAAATGDRP